jgi:hypothetical protein
MCQCSGDIEPNETPELEASGAMCSCKGGMIKAWLFAIHYFIHNRTYEMVVKHEVIRLPVFYCIIFQFLFEAASVTGTLQWPGSVTQ